MYPNTIFDIVDNSNISIPVEQTAVDDKPVFFGIFTSDKGSEEYGLYTAENFVSQFGDISFARHGQPLLQAAMTVNAGAALYCKRCVASDATLANLILCAELVDSSIKFVLNTATQAKSIADVVKSAKDMKTDTLLPIAVITDNGRGVSKKSIRIEADYRNSKSVDYVRYSIHVMEGSNELEVLGFSLDPEIIYNDANISLSSVISRRSSQIKCVTFDANIEALYEWKGDIEDIRAQDVLFGKDKDGLAIAGMIAEESIDLSKTDGYVLKSGDNGSLKDRPIDSDAYEAALLEAVTDHKEIYDINNMKLDAVVDANYPDSVKASLSKIVDFREDTMYLRDLGLGDNGEGFTNLESIKARLAEKVGENNDVAVFPASKAISTYCNSYDILDPYSKKQIKVTVCYDLAQKLVSHMVKGPGLPFAGQLHDMVFPNIIDGTINFVPVDLPNEASEKEELSDLRLNYISYYDGLATMETNYTSYDKYTDLSYINNVMGIQKLIKSIRRKCPKIRFSFLTGDDFSKYQAEVQNVIDREGSSFASIKLVYYADDRYESNGVYYAGLEVKCKKFVQAEYFKVTVI